MTALSGIDIFAGDVLDDPYPVYGRLREFAPVHRVPETDFYLVSTWELVAEAAARTEEFSSNLTGVLVRTEHGAPTTFDMSGGGQAVHVLATADEPDHRRHRKQVLPTLVAKRVRALEPVVRELAERLWTEGHDGDRIDWATAMADRLPLAMVAHLVGLPEQDVPRLLVWAYDSTELLSGIVGDDGLARLVGSAAELAGYLHAKFALAQADPRDDLIGDLARACTGGELAEHEAVLMLVQLVGAGGESTAGLIASAARLLATRADLQATLREHPESIDAFLDETLRLESPFRGHHRHVRVDAVLGGVPVPAGSHLLLLWGSANRDPAVFPDPDEFDLHRPNIRSHMAFGKGLHFCVGAVLARMEARVAVSLLLERGGLVALDGPDATRWVPSLFVRRHRRMVLAVDG
ncbi:cytochrome P450 [Rhodococcus spelaei]|uniref:Cytochrome P450 n=1 Tax=Rhodococcus spelaei TaxID=2546320 RepID=A0A541BA98_9NOCA|nr:cytochrome P450 [Rhodococcus spelaei]TQF69247.1 cytochrome P450 [Rhodococcus spelaei]